MTPHVIGLEIGQTIQRVVTSCFRPLIDICQVTEQLTLIDISRMIMKVELSLKNEEPVGWEQSGNGDIHRPSFLAVILHNTPNEQA